MSTCVDCGEYYELSTEEASWFFEKGLSLPKRCTTCRAMRRGFEDHFLTCRRCGKAFLYPREVQLYARTYKWPDPETCLGGCGERKFQQGYVPSPLEKKSLLVLGLELVGALLTGRARGSSGTPVGPKILGFNSISGFSNSVVQEIVSRVPELHLVHVREVIYIPTPFRIGTETHEVLFRGRYDPSSNVISINDQSPNSPERLRMAISHEIGHAAFTNVLSDDLRKQWSTLKGRDLLPTISHGNSEEDFCNCYAKYLTDPAVLLLGTPDKYYFLYDYVFEQKEFL